MLPPPPYSKHIIHLETVTESGAKHESRTLSNNNLWQRLGALDQEIKNMRANSIISQKTSLLSVSVQSIAAPDRRGPAGDSQL